MTTLGVLRRAHNKMTQAALAEAAGVKLHTICNIERGLVQSASWDTVTRLADALELPPAEVFAAIAETRRKATATKQRRRTGREAGRPAAHATP